MKITKILDKLKENEAAVIKVLNKALQLEEVN